MSIETSIPTVSTLSNNTTAANSSRYKLRSAEEILRLSLASYCVQDVLPSKGFACIYGAPSTGKSFLALSLACSIANGAPFFGRKTEKRPVVYIALEGANSLKNRIVALQLQTGQQMPTKLSFISQSFDALNPDEVAQLALALPSEAVVIIDTLNQAAPTADENGSKEMGRIILTAKELQQACNGLVIFVHHSGKDESKGPRGHSALLAALDTAILVAKSDKEHFWELAKSKDGESGQRFSFRLKQIVVASDLDGNPITSCIAEEVGTTQKYLKNLNGKVQKSALQVLVEHIKSVPVFPSCSGGNPSISFETALATLQTSLGENCPSPYRAKELVSDCVNAGRLQDRTEGTERWLWLT